MIGYKLTNVDMTTAYNTKWEVGVWKETSGTGPLCSSGWLHLYDHPLLASFLNPIHGNFKNPILWECEWEGATLDDNGMKRGASRLRLMKQIPLPTLTSYQRTKLAIQIAKLVYKKESWNKWADNWLNDINRSAAAAAAAAYAANAANAAANAANAAANAAADADAAAAADAAYAANAAANAAADAANPQFKDQFLQILEEVAKENE